MKRRCEAEIRTVLIGRRDADKDWSFRVDSRSLPLCFGQSSDEARAKLWGNWKADGNASSSETWELRDADGTLHMVRTESDRKNEVECNVMGRECKIKSPDGKPATVSFYFNGPKLIEWEKAGDKVVQAPIYRCGRRHTGGRNNVDRTER